MAKGGLIKGLLLPARIRMGNHMTINSDMPAPSQACQAWRAVHVEFKTKILNDRPVVRLKILGYFTNGEFLE